MQIVIWLVTFLAMLTLFTRYSRMGRACAEDLKMASLLGINTDRVISLTFVIGAAVLGIAEALTSAYLSTEYKDVVSFTLLIVVLLVMPTGILGRPEVEKV